MKKKPTNKEMREVAKREYHCEGEIEIDDNAKISRDPKNEDRGAYVQAWVWVYDSEVGSPILKKVRK
jgi:hypothetical protein